ncbi:MAG TPA: transposase [Chloroflexia bacterium]|nr:transposase [Chloroflexia bacterium]
MVRNHCLAKSILDAAWTEFRGFLAYKAAWAGRQFVAVNPAYTSQDCSHGGHRQKMPLLDAIALPPPQGGGVLWGARSARGVRGRHSCRRGPPARPATRGRPDAPPAALAPHPPSC